MINDCFYASEGLICLLNVLQLRKLAVSAAAIESGEGHLFNWNASSSSIDENSTRNYALWKNVIGDSEVPTDNTRKSDIFSMVVENNEFDLQSGGDINLKAGDVPKANSEMVEEFILKLGVR